MTYDLHMANRRQVLVQLSDELVAGLDREAGERGVNRSALIREALASFLERESVEALERRWLEGYRRIPPDLEVDGTWVLRELEREDPW